MLNEQKDWTLKLFLHNFLKENNLRNSLMSFENEVLQTSNFNQDLPIKSNKTFLFEWWNIFFYLYSERLIEDFAEKNRGLYSDRSLKEIKMSDLFINGTNLPTFFTTQNPEMNLMNNFSSGLGFNNFDNSKAFSRPLNMPYNNMNHISMQNDSTSFNNNVVFSNSNSNFDNVKKIGFEVSNQPNPLKASNDFLVKDFKNPTQNKIQMKPFVTNSTVSSNNQQTNFNSNDGRIKKEFLNKVRRRSIKNNKIVFVHSLNGAARKIANEAKESDDDLKGEDLNKLDENFDYSHSEMNYANSNQGNNNDNSGGNSNKKPRGSRYRGVSRNGNQWQVLIMVNKKKRYVGSYSNEEEAARAYDKAALQNHGTKAKTNFDYVDDDLKRIMGEPPILKIND